MFKASINIGRTLLANALRMASDRVRPADAAETASDHERAIARSIKRAIENGTIAVNDVVGLSPKAEAMIAEGIDAATEEDFDSATEEEAIKPLVGSLAWRHGGGR